MTGPLDGFTFYSDRASESAGMWCDACPYDPVVPDVHASDLLELVAAAAEHQRAKHTPPPITVEYVGPVVSQALAEQLMGSPEEQERAQAFVDIASRAVNAALESTGIVPAAGPTSYDVMMEQRRARQCRCNVVAITDMHVTDATPADVAAAIEARRARSDPYRRSADA